MLNKNYSDQDLWDAIVAGDSRAYDLLFKRYWKKLYITAYHYLKDKHTCEQIVQDIFIYLWDKREQLKIISFEKYLNTAARYHVYKQLNAKKTSPVSYVEDYIFPEEENNKNKGEEALLTADLVYEISTLLQQLPERCREIFVMSRLEHLSNGEIAEKLHISKRTVENQITHALKHLRNSRKYVAIFMLLSSLLK
ncbi:RNA polymerase sigma-70 factor (ECF subfamily) [Mucilaginibacter oryzae]|uniref:RNA polymerase sigma-70 factor (ECF subfamily) n=1 Tax=Mucilaginibacter oryzae TaxID=468058 RepID=A0A316HAX4_9SPHI|nr:RNA polymerase sigma-70 factor [Mucilaginibacter oryzae]PWK77201.1 RNA polymerase sigma-70 factor (ECF subfamily) [Mucilaginibacter oryzae]